MGDDGEPVDVAKSDLRRVSRRAHQVEMARLRFIESIILARDSGESLRDIAAAAGLSHQRVHQILMEPKQDET